MNDRLISLNAAIDALDKVAEMFPYRIPGNAKTYRQYNEAWSDAIDAAENALEALPSAQPDVPDINVGDMISRQAAIETVRKAHNIGQAHRMLVQLPSATDTNVGSNLIDRQAALDALDRLEYTPGEWATNGLTMCKDAIKALPSAQPTCTVFVPVDDCISRQAAIDMLKNRWKKTRNYEGIGDDIAEECELYLKQVPSAQPERDDCDTCKHHGYFGSVVCNNCRVRYPSYWESREGGQDD